jgi:hypothetical protein
VDAGTGGEVAMISFYAGFATACLLFFMADSIDHRLNR